MDLLSPAVCKAYTWITKNLHGLHWDSGVYPYEKLALFVESVKLRYSESTFYAKGLEKCIYLETLFQKPFINLDDLGCPKITSLAHYNVQCGQLSVGHSQTHHCARKKSQVLQRLG